MSDSTMGSPEAVREYPRVAGDSCSRAILQYFDRRSSEVATVEDLEAFIEEQDEEAQPDTDWRVAVRLHHVTLPKLDEAGVLDYDARSNTVRYQGDPAETA